MASFSERPSIDNAAARLVLAEDLPKVLALLETSMEALGWRQVGARTLLIPITGELAGTVDQYLLRLQFRSGRAWPPSAQFVNPATLEYHYPADAIHLPKIASPEVHVHPAYASPQTGSIQLVCCSATFEFYDVLHGGEPKHIWTEKDDFYRTVSAIRRAIGTNYEGRHPPNA